MSRNPDCRVGVWGCDCAVAPLVTREFIPSTAYEAGISPASELQSIIAKLLPRETRVLERIAKRLLMGQEQYGALTPGKKDWRKEAQEEAMDMSVYLSALLEEGNG